MSLVPRKLTNCTLTNGHCKSSYRNCKPSSLSTPPSSLLLSLLLLLLLLIFFVVLVFGFDRLISPFLSFSFAYSSFALRHSLSLSLSLSLLNRLDLIVLRLDNSPSLPFSLSLSLSLSLPVDRQMITAAADRCRYSSVSFSLLPPVLFIIIITIIFNLSLHFFSFIKSFLFVELLSIVILHFSLFIYIYFFCSS